VAGAWRTAVSRTCAEGTDRLRRPPFIEEPLSSGKRFLRRLSDLPSWRGPPSVFSGHAALHSFGLPRLTAESHVFTCLMALGAQTPTSLSGPPVEFRGSSIYLERENYLTTGNRCDYRGIVPPRFGLGVSPNNLRHHTFAFRKTPNAPATLSNVSPRLS